MKKTKALVYLLLLILTSTSKAYAAQPPDLSRLVVIGDSLLAGFRNSSLRSDWQGNGIAAVIARQAGVALAHPLIAPVGIPNPLEQADPQNPLAITRAPGVSSGRVDLGVQPFNLAVPGQTVSEAVSKRPDFPMDSLTDLVLGLPGLLTGQAKSQVEWAEALKPTTIVVWIGNNDVLNAALASDLAALTSEADFTSAYTTLMDRLAATGARLFVANLPDVGVIPYVVPVPVLAQLLGAPLPAIQAALGVATADFITLDHIPDALAILQGQKSGPLKGTEVLDAGEVAAIRALTAKHNALIAAKCIEKGARLVDMHSFLNQLVSAGAQAGNTRLSAQFLGGIFSLDGIHPTAEGAAVTANEFIRALNATGANIPPVVWLVMRREAQVMVVSWPSEASQYALQTAHQANGPWEFAPSIPTIEAGQTSVRVSLESGARFFRLAQAPAARTYSQSPLP